MNDAASLRNAESSRLADFSGLVDRLNVLVQACSPGEFQAAAMQAASDVLHFDSGLWAVGAVTETGSEVHSIHLFNQPPEMMIAWERIKHLDTLHQIALARLGEVVMATADGPVAGPPFDAAIRAHTRRYGMQHIAATIFVDPLSRLFTAVSLYRSDAMRPFAEIDQVMARCVIAQLTSAWRRHRLESLVEDTVKQASNAVALADPCGVLHVASDSFMRLLLLQWPHWTGPRLPEEFARHAAGSFATTDIVVESRPQAGLVRHHLRRRLAIDDLSKRELEVAQHFVRGLNHLEIARELHISPQTVRNHVKHIYAKTGLHNKAQLAQMVFRSSTGSA
jgi:DNA-binding CsgD family transcriptional regulator